MRELADLESSTARRRAHKSATLLLEVQD